MGTLEAVAKDLEESARIFGSPYLSIVAATIRTLDPARRRAPAAPVTPLDVAETKVYETAETFRQTFANKPYPDAAVRAAQTQLAAVQDWANTRRETLR